MNRSACNGAALNGSGFLFAQPEYQILGYAATMRSFAASRRWAVSSERIAQTIYICTLDGIRLPMSSFQARLRDGQPTYFGAVVPMVEGLVEDIQDRTGGVLTLHSGVLTATGREILEPMVVTTMHSVRYDKGARSGSITVVGYVTETTTTSKVVEISGISTIGLQAEGGKRNVRCEPSFFLRPGDVATWGDEQMIVGMIALTINPRSATMDLTER